MFRALWFLTKLAVVVLGVVFILKNEGTLRIENWNGYEIEADIRFVFAVLLSFLFIWTFAYRIYRAIVTVPLALKKYRQAAKRERGYLALTQGLVAVAAGDAQMAEKYSKRAQIMIPGAPLSKLLSAQAALLQGNAPKARVEFQALLDDDAAAIFGVRGLLNETLDAGNYKEALGYIRHAERLQPKRIWVVKTLFDLETKNRDFLSALKTLKRAEKLNVFDAKTVLRHRQALFMALANNSVGDAAKQYRYIDAAFSIDAGFTPAAVALAQHYIAADKQRAAIKTLQKAWAANPHGDLATLWLSLAPVPKKKASVYDHGREAYAWAQQLYELRPDHRASQRLLGEAALSARMMREARDLFIRSLDYRALARLERLDTGNEAKAREWLEMSADAPQEPQWICASCGHSGHGWHPLCGHCQSFNSYEWVIPSVDLRDFALRAPYVTHDLLAPPAS